MANLDIKTTPCNYCKTDDTRKAFQTMMGSWGKAKLCIVFQKKELLEIVPQDFLVEVNNYSFPGILFSNSKVVRYFTIQYCPKCGRRLTEDANSFRLFRKYRPDTIILGKSGGGHHFIGRSLKDHE
ncbi:hypothetical protein ACKX2D_05305 [Lachnospiraceae bacterium YH-ros2226]